MPDARFSTDGVDLRRAAPKQAVGAAAGLVLILILAPMSASAITVKADCAGAVGEKDGNQIFQSSPIPGSGGTISNLGENPNKLNFTIVCKDQLVTISDTAEGDKNESYSITFNNPKGDGATFRISLDDVYLTKDGKQVGPVAPRFDSAFIFPGPGGPNSLTFGLDRIDLNGATNPLSFDDFHFRVLISSTREATFSWDSVAFSVDANTVSVAVPLPAAAALLPAGLLALGAAGWRRRAAGAARTGGRA